MQEIDSTFDEKNQGYSKFSRFCQEAAQKGLLSVTKLDNGQLEIDLPNGTASATTTTTNAPTTEPAEGSAPVSAVAPAEGEEREDRGPRRSRRGRGGRGRGRDREDRPPREGQEQPEAEAQPVEHEVERPAQLELTSEPKPQIDAGNDGERLTRAEAFDLVRRTVDDLASGDESIRASDVRSRARQLLGRDSESLSDRMFVRILKDAHDEGLIDLRRRGDDFEVARAAEAASVADQIASNDRVAAAAAAPAVPATPAPRLGMGPRAVGGRGRPGAPPPNLLSFGVVGGESKPVATPAAPPTPATPATTAPATNGKEGSVKPARAARGKTPAKKAAASPPAAKAKKTAAKKAAPAPRARGKKPAGKSE